jgi:two-component system sensor histidine kinase TctE
MNLPRSLRARLLVMMTAVFVLGILAALISYRIEVDGLVRDIHQRTLQAQARAVLQSITRLPDGKVDVRPAADWQEAYSDPSRLFSYTIYDSAGRVLASSPNLAAPLPEIGLEADQRTGPIQFIGAGRNLRAALAARGPDGEIAVVARGDFAPDALADSLFAEDAEQVLTLVPFGLLALVLIWFISGWSLRPIARASSEAALVGAADPEKRISAEGLPAEVRPLVDAVNGALDRLSRAYAAEKRLTADAAHELRTPLTVLDLRLQRARLTGQVDWAAIARELAHMKRLVGQLMDLARKETLAQREPMDGLPVVNLSRVIREAAAMVVPLMESQERRLEVDVPDSGTVRGDADDLRDMMRNLLENAAVHGRGGVAVTLRSDGDASSRVLAVEVSDEGGGVPRGQEEAVFERFRKLDAAAPGAGLGLAIVRQVVRRHGGEVRMVPGRGCVVLTLPAVTSTVAGQAEDKAAVLENDPSTSSRTPPARSARGRG